MAELDGLLNAVVTDTLSEARWQVLADWLEEYDDPQRAELLRLHRRLIATCLEPAYPERPGWQGRVVGLLAAGVQPCLPRQVVDLGGGVTMTFAWIPPGTFLMGSPASEAERSDDETLHRVTLTQGYWLGVHPVTQAQWRAVMGENPSWFESDDLPVETVSWDDCQAFCTKLGEKTGKRLRLPTEAEWEYACRAGTTTPFHFGDTISTDQANYDGNYTDGRGKKGTNRQKTTPVGTFPANAWGLHDLHGNVWEWCQDWYGDYPSIDIKYPQYPLNGAYRVLRGGSWGNCDWICRAACRGWSFPDNRGDDYGCRVLLFPERD